MGIYDAAFEAISAEATEATDLYGDFASSHEAYGVLAEEVAELLDAIRGNSAERIAHEALQVCAVALRLCEICVRKDPSFLKRSGCA